MSSGLVELESEERYTLDGQTGRTGAMPESFSINTYLKLGLDAVTGHCRTTNSMPWNHNASLGINSPPFIVPKACQTTILISLDIKVTDPSPNTTFTPPGCVLRAEVYIV